jgi:ankyrin repeat protein
MEQDEVFELARSGATAELVGSLEGGIAVNAANEHGDTLLMLAAYHAREATVRALLERGADPGLANDKGQTPLAAAVFKKDPGIVRALLDAGADPHAGAPSAVDAARMFGAYKFLDWFGLGPKF